MNPAGRPRRPARALFVLLALAGAVVMVAVVVSSSAASASTGPPDAVLVTRVEGAITPVVADQLTDGVRRAAADGRQAYLVELDTPGGLDTSMRQIIRSFLAADVPVIVHVTPPGARAASAGALITFAAHVAAMAPGTTIGAATPVDLQGGQITDKVVNDAAAFAESVARQRGRNVEFAVATVRQGRAVTAQEAVELGAVDLLARNRTELLRALDGRPVQIDEGTTVTLRTAGAPVVEQELSLARRILQILADPNLAFLFLSVGVLALLYELASPGAGLGGVIGAVMLVLAFFALSVLPVTAAGLTLLALAAALFAAELFTPGIGVFAAGGALALLLAGLFLFESPVGVSLAVLLPTVIVVGLGAVLAGRLALKARRARPTTGTEALTNRTTTLRSADGLTGRVRLDGTWWTVRSTEPLAAGRTVRVTGTDGLTLLVEPLDEDPDRTEEPS